MDYEEGDRRINERERGGCGERMATILEWKSSNSTVHTISVLIILDISK